MAGAGDVGPSHPSLPFRFNKPSPPQGDFIQSNAASISTESKVFQTIDKITPTISSASMSQPNTMANRSRKRPAQRTCNTKKNRIVGKKRLGFLDLPGETRNEIYAYCFDGEIWVDMTPNANHVLKQSKIQPGTWASAALYTAFSPAPDPPNNADATTDAGFTVALTPMIKMLPYNRPKPHKLNYHPNPPRGRSSTNTTTLTRPTNWRTSAGALVLTCRQIHAEALPFFYATPFFIFSAPNALLKFLRLLPPAKLALVRKLHVAHATYGDPHATADAVWKARSERTWGRAMREASEKLVGLEVLRVRVVVNERPLVFGMGEAWVSALMVWAGACRREVDVVPGTGRPRVGAPAPLRVEVGVQSAWVMRKAWMPEENLRGALIELHRLFAEAVRRVLFGWSEEDAMVEFNLTKFDKYKNLVRRYPLP